MPASDERVHAAATPGQSTTEPGPRADKKDAGIRPSVLTAAALVTLVLVMVRVTVHAGMPLDNGDTWFHLRIGHLLWGPWSITHPGGLTEAASSPWLPTQWSTEMLAAKVEDWFGLPGVAWLFGAMFLVFMVVVYVVCRRRASTLPAVVATGLAVIASAPALSARPQVISLALLAVVVGCWLRAWEHGQVPWVLVPVTWVWATAHGLWTAGVIVSVVSAVGLVLDRRVDRRTAWRMAAVPVLSVVAACLTPLGPRLLTTQLAVGERTHLIGEWQATSFRTIPALVVGVMAAALLARWARGGSRVPWTHLLLFLVACGWAALVTRMVACGGVVLAPLLAAGLQGLLEDRIPLARPGRAEKVVVAGGVLGCLLALALAVPHTASKPGHVPDAFAPRLAALPKGSPVVVEDATGSWIEWRFPGLQPTIDGMLDAYPVDYMADFANFHDVAPGWQRFLASTHARDAVVVKGSRLSTAMQEQLHWRMVQKDGTWVYLVAPGS
jgi:hypothetical protein